MRAVAGRRRRKLRSHAVTHPSLGIGNFLSSMSSIKGARTVPSCASQGVLPCFQAPSLSWDRVGGNPRRQYTPCETYRVAVAPKAPHTHQSVPPCSVAKPCMLAMALLDG